MSDNVTYSNVPSGVPAGNVIATDSVDDTHYQRVKLDIGGDGVSVPVEDLATSAKQDTANTALGTLATSAKQDTLLTELQGKADLDENQPVIITDGTDSADVVTAADDDTDIDGLNGLVTNAILCARIDADTIKPLRMDASTHSIQTIEYEHHEIHSGSHYYIEGHTTLANTAVLRVKLVTPNSDKYSHFVWEIGSSTILTTDLYEGASGGMAGGARAVIHANNRNVNCWSGSHTGAVDQATVLTDSTKAWTPDALIGMQVFNQTDGSSAFITDNDATTVTVAALTGGTGNDWDTNDVYEINNSQMVITSGVAVATTAGLLISDGGWGDRKTGGGGQKRGDEIILKPNTTYYRVFTSGAGAADNIVSFKASWYEHTAKD